MEEPAQRVYQESTNLQQAMVLARTVARGSTGMLQDKPLKNPAGSVTQESIGWEQEGPVKHPARTAARASTEMLQDKPLKHPARHVPRTRTRLLRAVFVPPALATQTTVATPAQGIAQLV